MSGQSGLQSLPSNTISQREYRTEVCETGENTHTHTHPLVQSDTFPQGAGWKEFLSTRLSEGSLMHISFCKAHTDTIKQINWTFTLTLIDLEKYISSLLSSPPLSLSFSLSLSYSCPNPSMGEKCTASIPTDGMWICAWFMSLVINREGNTTPIWCQRAIEGEQEKEWQEPQIKQREWAAGHQYIRGWNSNSFTHYLRQNMGWSG